MNVFRLIVLLGLIGTSGMSCSGPEPVQGRLTDWKPGEWKEYIYLIESGKWSNLAASYLGIVRDSFPIDANGYFALPAERLPVAKEPQIWQLALQRPGTAYLNQLDNAYPDSSNYFPLVYQEGNQIRIQAESDLFQGSLSIIDPSEANTAMLALRDLRIRAFKEYLIEKAAAEGLLEEEQALLHYQEKLFAFAEKTTEVLVALTAIRWASVENYYERVPEQLFAQAQKWKKRAPEHPWVQELVSRASPEVLPLLIGGQLPDQRLPMVSGDTLQTHNLLGAELTILDLWASWCGPCRKENRQVLGPLWEQYAQQGLEIIGYALEAEQTTWLTAIQADRADRWPQASHLNGDDSPFFQSLNIQTIPANFILNKEGVVLAKNLHGSELKEFVHLFFSNN